MSAKPSAKLGVDNPALLCRIFIIRVLRLLNDCNHTTSGFEFELLPPLKAGLPLGSRWYDNRLFIFGA